MSHFNHVMEQALELPNGMVVATGPGNTLFGMGYRSTELFRIRGTSRSPYAAMLLTSFGDQIVTFIEKRGFRIVSSVGDVEWEWGGSYHATCLAAVDKETFLVGLHTGKLSLYGADTVLKQRFFDPSTDSPVTCALANLGECGDELVSGSEDGTFRRWSLDGTLLSINDSHKGTITALTCFGTGGFVSVSLDGTWMLWDTLRAEAVSTGHVPADTVEYVRHMIVIDSKHLLLAGKYPEASKRFSGTTVLCDLDNPERPKRVEDNPWMVVGLSMLEDKRIQMLCSDGQTRVYCDE